MDTTWAATTLHLPASTMQTILDHAQAEHPREACGIVACRRGTNTPTRVIPMVNAEQSETNYSFDTEQWLRINDELDTNSEDPLVFYHSHTRSEPIPSRDDIRMAAYPDAWYLIVSTWSRATRQARAYRIGGGVAVETPLHTTFTYRQEEPCQPTD